MRGWVNSDNGDLDKSFDPLPVDEAVAESYGLLAARVDLGLALLAANKLDEAAAVTRQAVESGRVVPSNRWRVLEVVRAVEARGLPEAPELREAYRDIES